jgi:CubicO group peptidase (beta-lactamase class C family)
VKNAHPARALALSILFAAAPAVSAAETAAAMELESRLRAAAAWMDQRMTSSVAPGATAALVHDQSVLWSHAYGYADLDAGRPATPATTFSVCSISKLFTSVAIMDLVESGQLSLDATLDTYLAGFDPVTADGVIDEPVTIRALLSHASGLNREGVGAYWNTLDFPPEADLESIANPAGMLFTPLTRYQYSNIGMSLLGRVVAEVSGETYSEYVQRRILDPLELATVSTDLPLDGDGGRFATGYTDHDARGARQPVTPYRLNGLAPAAGFAASVLDLAKFAAWQFRLLETGDEEVLQRVTLRNMHRVHWMDPADPESAIFGLGFGHEKFKDVAMVGHGGYCLGHRAHFAMQPGKKLAVVAMVNANDIDPRLVAAAIFGLTAEAIAAQMTAAAPADAEVLARVRTLQELEGRFGWPGLPEGFYVIPAADGRLQLVDLYGNDPAGSARAYEHVEGDTYRRRRKDEALGETLVFERDDRGAVVSLLTEGYRYFRQ